MVSRRMSKTLFLFHLLWGAGLIIFLLRLAKNIPATSRIKSMMMATAKMGF
jgi:hypothetical protein